jgi:hypothetical protein
MSELVDLESYLNNIGDKIPEAALEAVKEQVDYEADSYYKELQRTTPRRTGALVRSLKMTKISTPDKYGYRIEYTGERAGGASNEMVANILDHGTSKIPARHFRTRALRKLKGLDGRIYVLYQKKTEKING